MDTDTDRAQLIIIAALLIAVLFVGLAVVVNSAIYTENVATRGATTTGDIVAEDTESIQRIEESLADANYYDDTADFDERESRVHADLEEWNTKMAGQSARAGQVTGYESAGMTEGVRVSQDETGDFMPAGEDLVQELLDTTLDPFGLEDRTSWLVASDVTTRAFELTVDRDALASPPDGVLDNIVYLIDWIIDGNDVFSVEFVTEDITHRVYLIEQDGDIVALVTEQTSDDPSDQTIIGNCSVSSGEATIRLSSGEIISNNHHKPCEAFSFVDDIEQYDIYYGGATNVNGTYQFISDKPESEFLDDVDDQYDSFIENILNLITCVLGSCDFTVFESEPNADGHPYTTSAVYDVSVTTTYTDDRISHERTVQVAPEAA